MNFASRLTQQISKKDSRLLVGLDPHPGKIPESYIKSLPKGDTEEVLFSYFKEVIEATLPFAVAYKPQIAFFEANGLAGLKALQRLLSYLRSKGELVILDGKRNDIGSTAKAYAAAYLKKGADFESDGLTINAYLGSDGVLPFLDYPEKSVFALLKTSNPSSGELQDLGLASGETLYEHLAELITTWNKEHLDPSGYGPIGCVIGATYPDHMAQLRSRLPHSILLVPGFGAQGGSQDAVRAAFHKDGLGAIINSSRQINFPADFEARGFDAVREAARDVRDTINELAH